MFGRFSSSHERSSGRIISRAMPSNSSELSARRLAARRLKAEATELLVVGENNGAPGAPPSAGRSYSCGGSK